jgi:hypothetical protein
MLNIFFAWVSCIVPLVIRGILYSISPVIGVGSIRLDAVNTNPEIKDVIPIAVNTKRLLIVFMVLMI